MFDSIICQTLIMFILFRGVPLCIQLPHMDTQILQKHLLCLFYSEEHPSAYSSHIWTHRYCRNTHRCWCQSRVSISTVFYSCKLANYKIGKAIANMEIECLFYSSNLTRRRIPVFLSLRTKPPPLFYIFLINQDMDMALQV